jgi:F-type H+-transporting ATPase subunit epsilon
MFKLTVVTPERRLVLSQAIDEVTVHALRGELNILPGHAPLITIISTGIMRWKLKGQSQQNAAVVSWGYCEVHPEGVEILADVADLREEIDVNEAQKVLLKSEARLLNESLDDVEWKSVHRDVARARADIALASAPKF